MKIYADLQVNSVKPFPYGHTSAISDVRDDTVDEVWVTAVFFQVIYAANMEFEGGSERASHSFDGFQTGSGLVWFGVTQCHRTSAWKSTRVALGLRR